MAERDSSLFPPAEYWLINPYERRHTIKTPTDNRGLVIVDELIETVNATVAPDYQWATEPENIDMHHLMGDPTRYPWVKAPHNPARFRQLPINMLYLPRDFHNLLTMLTVDPPRPPFEIMAQQNEAWAIASALFKKAEDTEEAVRQQIGRRRDITLGLVEVRNDANGEDKYATEWLRERYEKHLKGFWQNLYRYQGLSPELRLVELEEEATDMELVGNVVDGLKKIVKRRALPVPELLAA